MNLLKKFLSFICEPRLTRRCRHRRWGCECGFIGTTMAIIGAASLATKVVSGVIGSRAAGKASRTQAEAADRAAELEKESRDKALAFQRETLGQSREDLAPWLQTGRGALANLGYLMGIPSPQSGDTPTQRAIPSEVANRFNNSGRPEGLSGVFGEGVGRNQRFLSGEEQLPRMFGSDRITGAMQAELDRRRGGVVQNEDGSVSLDVPQTGVLGPGGGITAAAPGSGGVGSPGGAVDPNGNPVAGGGVDENGNPIDPLVNTALGGYGSLMETFGDQDFEATPGYQFRLQEGMDTLQYSAAARGDLLTGATAEALTRYGQDYASGEYQAAYNRFNQNQSNRFRRLSAVSGFGQTAAGQLGAFGSQAAGNYGNILLNSSRGIGQAYQDAGAARASGYVGSTNAWQSALQGGVGLLADLPWGQRRRNTGYSPASGEGAGG